MSSQVHSRSWLYPESLRSAALLFSLSYVLWQPIAQFLVVHLVVGRPIPFVSLAQWRDFLFACAALGVVAGPVWLLAQRMLPGSWMRAWLHASVTVVSLQMMMSADRFLEMGVLEWSVVLVAASLFTGALFMPFWRWSARVEHRR